MSNTILYQSSLPYRSLNDGNTAAGKQDISAPASIPSLDDNVSMMNFTVPSTMQQLPYQLQTGNDGAPNPMDTVGLMNIQQYMNNHFQNFLEATSAELASKAQAKLSTTRNFV